MVALERKRVDGLAMDLQPIFGVALYSHIFSRIPG